MPASSAQVHVTSGDAAATTLQQGLALAPSSILVHRDVLSCGPILGFESLPAWRQARYAYWHGTTDGRLNPRRTDDLLWQAERLRDAARGHREIWLWLGTALSDQLLLVLMVQIFDRLGIDLARLSTIQIGASVSRTPPGATEPLPQEPLGIGLLRPDELREHPAAEALTEARAVHARRAWQAITSDVPDRLLAFLAKPDADLREEAGNPFLQRAMSGWLERFPARTSGLCRWDEALLAACDRGPRRAREVVASAMASRRDTRDIAGDVYLLARLRRLGDAGLASPALTLAGDGFDLEACAVALTDAGAAIGDGSASFLTLNRDCLAADDWVAGMHLRPRDGRVFYREGSSALTA